jgi:hypothetical protein
VPWLTILARSEKANGAIHQIIKDDVLRILFWPGKGSLVTQCQSMLHSANTSKHDYHPLHKEYREVSGQVRNTSHEIA